MEQLIEASNVMLNLMRKLYLKTFITKDLKAEMAMTCQYYKAELQKYREQQQAKAPKQASLL